VPPDTALAAVVEAFQTRSIGSVLITHANGTLAGIFTERDCVRRALPDFTTNQARPVSEFMTKDPVAQPPDITIAFALNLMSEGGFRHLPLVDSDNHPVGIISVRDMMDFIVGTFIDELLKFELPS
jgi:CBS domain-containing protein